MKEIEGYQLYIPCEKEEPLAYYKEIKVDILGNIYNQFKEIAETKPLANVERAQYPFFEGEKVTKKADIPALVPKSTSEPRFTL